MKAVKDFNAGEQFTPTKKKEKMKYVKEIKKEQIVNPNGEKILITRFPIIHVAECFIENERMCFHEQKTDD